MHVHGPLWLVVAWVRICSLNAFLRDSLLCPRSCVAVVCQAEEESGVYKAIQRDPLKLDSPVWSRITASARELICGLLEKDPSKRYVRGHQSFHRVCPSLSLLAIRVCRCPVSSCFVSEIGNYMHAKSRLHVSCVRGFAWCWRQRC